MAPVYAFGVSGIIGDLVHTMMGLRVSEDHEVSGIDLVLHAESDDLHATSSSASNPGGRFSQGGHT